MGNNENHNTVEAPKFYSPHLAPDDGNYEQPLLTDSNSLSVTSPSPLPPLLTPPPASLPPSMSPRSLVSSSSLRRPWSPSRDKLENDAGGCQVGGNYPNCRDKDAASAADPDADADAD